MKFYCNQKKEEITPHQKRICVTCKYEKQLFKIASCIGNLFSQTFAKSPGNYPLRRVITATLQLQLYLNHSPQWIFFFQYSRNLEIFFWKNISERLQRQLVPTCLNVMTLNSSSHRRSSRKIAILKICAVFTEKPLCWSLFWIKLQAWRHAWKPVTLLKRNFNTGAFL